MNHFLTIPLCQGTIHLVKCNKFVSFSPLCPVKDLMAITTWNFSFLLFGSLLSGRSVNEFVEACKKATGVNIKVDFLPRRPGDYAEVFSDPTKIRDELNWTARYTNLQESLEIAWRWQKSHRDGYGSPS